MQLNSGRLQGQHALLSVSDGLCGVSSVTVIATANPFEQCPDVTQSVHTTILIPFRIDT